MGKAIIVPGVSFALQNLGTVTPIIRIPISGLTITGDSTVTNTSSYSVEYTPSNTTETGVVWEITSGSEYATINSSGVLTATTLANNSSVTIKATSSYNSSIFATKVVVVSFEYELEVMPQNITLMFSGSYPVSLLLKSSGDSNGLERMLYSPVGTVKLNTFPEWSGNPGALQYITNDMYMIDIPEGATGVRVSGSNLYFNTRNVRVSTLKAISSSATERGLVENTLDSVPSDIQFTSGAKYLYIRITVAAQGNTYVLPKITWLYE